MKIKVRKRGKFDGRKLWGEGGTFEGKDMSHY
jgi:hypothetical protein